MKSISDLIRKYNRSGPRYTSYPTTLLLKPISKMDQFYRDLRMVSDTGKELSLYIHLPFCRTLCWYCGCNKVISRNLKDADRYLDYLERDFQLSNTHLPVGRTVTQVHFGGGTPTFLSPEQLLRLKLLIQQYFDILPDAECSVEMDPRHMTKAHVQMLKSIGFNRASIGVQDLNEEVQMAIHRGEMPVHIAYKLSADDILRKDIIMRLMCGLALDWHDLDLEYQTNTQVYFREELRKLDVLEADGLVESDAAGVRVTEKGRLFLRNIAMIFDAWLPEKASKPSFSKTI